MTEIEKHNIFHEKIILITFGGPSDKTLKKARIKPITDGDRSYYQFEKIVENKAYHTNIEKGNLERIFSEIINEFKNSVIYTDAADYYIRKNKKGKLSVMKRKATKAEMSPNYHNVRKNYLIPEGRPVDFLIKLGIMDSGGQVFKKQYSKFRQINRFLELVDDEFELFEGKDTIRIADLCCGKGYLTLALHHYFTGIRGKKTDISGMDLKYDVVNKLNQIVADLSLVGIAFESGDIADAVLSQPDMVVALHACDTATDLALAKAVEAESELILSVPCCQHELFNQLKNEDLSPILKYGIMKDKFTELATNALRGLALEARGYKVRMIEFTSIEHTMKNVMIKAKKDGTNSNGALEEFYSLSSRLNVKSSAEKILKV
jgi:hypothetical protein